MFYYILESNFDSVIKKLSDNADISEIELTPYLISNSQRYELALALKINCTLKKLRITNIISEIEELLPLIEGLKENTSIAELYINQSEMGDKGAIAIAELLTSNKSIKTLNLDESPIDNEGAIVIVEALMLNKSLLAIDMGIMSSVNNELVNALVELIKHNNTLKRLCLETYTDSFSDEMIRVLRRAQNKNNSIMFLDLNDYKSNELVDIVRKFLCNDPLNTQQINFLIKTFNFDSLLEKQDALDKHRAEIAIWLEENYPQGCSCLLKEITTIDANELDDLLLRFDVIHKITLHISIIRCRHCSVVWYCALNAVDGSITLVKSSDSNKSNHSMYDAPDFLKENPQFWTDNEWCKINKFKGLKKK